MKKLNKFGIILFTGLTIVLSSCSKDSGGGSGSAALGTITAKIGGTNFTSITQGTFATLATNGAFQNLSIGGADITGKSMQFMILGTNIAAGTYQITEADSDTPTSAVYTELDINNPTSAQAFAAPYDGGGVAGSIVISTITATNVTGTFSFTGKGESGSTKAITEGSFNVNITN